MSEQKVYRKHQSFIELHHKKPLENTLPRIERLREGLTALKEPGYRKTILQQAYDELLGRATNLQGHAPFAMHSNSIEEINRLTDEELPRYLFYRYRYEVFPDRRRLDAYPPLLQIEPSSVCNYRCVFCYQTDKVFTKRSEGHMGMMSVDLFRQIIDQAQGQCEAITLASRGEPLIHPQINEMLAYASGKFLAMKMNTNAWYLDEAKCHAILSSGMNTLVFSADAAAEPQYSQFRVGGNLERILKNITLFHDIREKHYPHSRLITRVSGVKVPGTPDLDEMERFWGNLVDQIAFVAYNPWEDTYDQPVNSIAIPCSDLWRRAFVWWDGTVNPCDVDYKSTLAVGKLPDHSIGQLWRSEGYEKLRANHLQTKRSQCFPCNRCSVI